MSHTTSRVLQAAVKAAGADARAAVLAEVAPDALPLAKSSYGHFLLTKLISLAPKEEVPGESKEGGGGGSLGAPRPSLSAGVPDGTHQSTALSFQRRHRSAAPPPAEAYKGPETPPPFLARRPPRPGSEVKPPSPRSVAGSAPFGGRRVMALPTASHGGGSEARRAPVRRAADRAARQTHARRRQENAHAHRAPLSQPWPSGSRATWPRSSATRPAPRSSTSSTRAPPPAPATAWRQSFTAASTRSWAGPRPRRSPPRSRRPTRLRGARPWRGSRRRSRPSWTRACSTRCSCTGCWPTTMQWRPGRRLPTSQQRSPPPPSSAPCTRRTAPAWRSLSWLVAPPRIASCSCARSRGTSRRSRATSGRAPRWRPAWPSWTTRRCWRKWWCRSWRRRRATWRPTRTAKGCCCP